MVHSFTGTLSGAILKKSLSVFVLTAFVVTSLISPSYAQVVFNLPQPGQMVGLSDSFAPVVLKGVTMHPEDPFLFDFIVDNGRTGLQGAALTAETTKLVKYFLAGLAVPEKELWVNLSPKEKDRIMAENLSHTDVGRELLAQDYLLKQITSSLLYPEKDLGRKFWDEVYSRTYAKFGNTDVPVDAFNKVWIMPDEATVYQNGNNAFVAGAHLKVMLESDYKAEQENRMPSGGHGAPPSDYVRDSVSPSTLPNDAALDVKATQVADRMPSAHDIAKDIMRAAILPVLEKEVNEGKNFATLRQVFQSLILSGWYKNALKTSLLNQVYSNTNKVAGITIPEKNAREQVYAQYLEAYQKGVYNYVKDEFDLNTRETTPRKYFSGGITDLAMTPKVVTGMDAAESVFKLLTDTTRVSYKFMAVAEELGRNIPQVKDALLKDAFIKLEKQGNRIKRHDYLVVKKIVNVISLFNFPDTKNVVDRMINQYLVNRKSAVSLVGYLERMSRASVFKFKKNVNYYPNIKYLKDYRQLIKSLSYMGAVGWDVSEIFTMKEITPGNKRRYAEFIGRLFEHPQEWPVLEMAAAAFSIRGDFKNRGRFLNDVIWQMPVGLSAAALTREDFITYEQALEKLLARHIIVDKAEVAGKNVDEMLRADGLVGHAKKLRQDAIKAKSLLLKAALERVRQRPDATLDDVDAANRIVDVIALLNFRHAHEVVENLQAAYRSDKARTQALLGYLKIIFKRSVFRLKKTDNDYQNISIKQLEDYRELAGIVSGMHEDSIDVSGLADDLKIRYFRFVQRLITHPEEWPILKMLVAAFGIKEDFEHKQDFLKTVILTMPAGTALKAFAREDFDRYKKDIGKLLPGDITLDKSQDIPAATAGVTYSFENRRELLALLEKKQVLINRLNTLAAWLMSASGILLVAGAAMGAAIVSLNGMDGLNDKIYLLSMAGASLPFVAGIWSRRQAMHYQRELGRALEALDSAQDPNTLTDAAMYSPERVLEVLEMSVMIDRPDGPFMRGIFFDDYQHKISIVYDEDHSKKTSIRLFYNNEVRFDMEVPGNIVTPDDRPYSREDIFLIIRKKLNTDDAASTEAMIDNPGTFSLVSGPSGVKGWYLFSNGYVLVVSETERDGRPVTLAVLKGYRSRLLGSMEYGQHFQKKSWESFIRDIKIYQLYDDAQAIPKALNNALVPGGIDLGHGHYLEVIATDAAGMPKFDPAQVQRLEQGLSGLVPVPVGLPQPVNLRLLLGLDLGLGKDAPCRRQAFSQEALMS